MRQVKGMTDSLKQLHTRVRTSHGKLGLCDADEMGVISGRRALDKAKQLNNTGAMKRMLNGYIKQGHRRNDKFNT